MSDVNMVELNAVMEMHRSATTHRERSVLEAMILNIVGSRKNDRHLLRELTGIRTYEFEIRSYCRLSGSEFIWSMLDEHGVAIGTVRKILVSAKRESAVNGQALDDVLRDMYVRISSVGYTAKTKTGVSYRSQRPDAVRSSWGSIHSSIRAIMLKELGHLDPIEHARLEKGFDLDLKALIHQYKVRVNALARSGLPTEDKTLRRRFLVALDEIGLERPGRTINQDYADKLRKGYRRRLADSHPDRHPGNDHMIEKFRCIVEAYKTVEEYLATKGLN